MLKRFPDKIYIFYDSDRAGIAAALRGIEKMFEQNINPGIITLAGTGIKDPDDFIREHGIQGFKDLIEQAGDGFRFLIGTIAGQQDLKIPEQKNHAIRTVLNYIEKIGEPIIRDEYIRMVADYFKVDEAALKARNRGTRAKKEQPGPGKPLAITPAERIFLESLLTMPRLIGEIKELINSDILSVLASHNIIALSVRSFNPETGDIDDYRSISDHLSDAERMVFREVYERAQARLGDADIDQGLLEERIMSSFLQFQEMLNKQRTRKLDQEIKMAERQDNFEMVQRLVKEKARYIKSKYEKKQSFSIGGTVD